MKWLLIDLSYLTHRARYACNDLTHEDIPTGIIYSFFEQLYSICEKMRSNKVLVFTDSKKSYRLKAFSGYKKKRKEEKTKEEQEQLNIMYKQINKLKNKILPKLGFPVYRQTGLESDDLIAWAAKKFNSIKEEAVIITSDGDLLQCITPYVKWYDPSKELLMDEKSFERKYDIPPKEWDMVKALAGCSSDCVPGLKGIGEKGAIKYVRGEMETHTKQFKMISENHKEIVKWFKLVSLPHEKTKQFEIVEPEYNRKSFFSFCKHFGIMSYLEQPKKNKWIEFFKGEFKGQPRKAKRRKLL